MQRYMLYFAKESGGELMIGIVTDLPVSDDAKIDIAYDMYMNTIQPFNVADISKDKFLRSQSLSEEEANNCFSADKYLIRLRLPHAADYYVTPSIARSQGMKEASICVKDAEGFLRIMRFEVPIRMVDNAHPGKSLRMALAGAISLAKGESMGSVTGSDILDVTNEVLAPYGIKRIGSMDDIVMECRYGHALMCGTEEVCTVLDLGEARKQLIEEIVALPGMERHKVSAEAFLEDGCSMLLESGLDENGNLQTRAVLKAPDGSILGENNRAESMAGNWRISHGAKSYFVQARW